MHSYEILREAADTIGVKALAAQLRLSPALVYKWCQAASPDDADSGGARNPLDRLQEIVQATGSTKVVNWLCHEAHGFFVPNPSQDGDCLDTALLINTQRLVEEFSQLLSTVTRSIEDDGRIDPAEADRIRQSWESLKSTVESFTVACERGLFHAQEEANE